MPHNLPLPNGCTSRCSLSTRTATRPCSLTKGWNLPDATHNCSSTFRKCARDTSMPLPWWLICRRADALNRRSCKPHKWLSNCSTRLRHAWLTHPMWHLHAHRPTCTATSLKASCPSCAALRMATPWDATSTMWLDLHKWAWCTSRSVTTATTTSATRHAALPTNTAVCRTLDARLWPK